MKKMTNYEFIKSLTVAQIANWAACNVPCNVCPVYDACAKQNEYYCEELLKNWLNSEWTGTWNLVDHTLKSRPHCTSKGEK